MGMGLAQALVCLAVAASAAQGPTTVPEFDVPIGGPTGVSGRSVVPSAALTAPVLALTPGLGLSPVPAPAIIPAQFKAQPVALQPVALRIATAARILPAATVADAPEKKTDPGAATFDGAKTPAPVDLDAVEAGQGEKAVDLILRDYDPAGHAFVGVGRSPAIVVAQMQNRSPGLAKTLPLSDFYHHPEGRENYYPPLTPAVENRLFDHFDLYLPPESLTGGKKLVLLDYVKGGRSMIALDEYLKRYAARRRPSLRWEFFALGMDHKHVGFVESGRSYQVLTPAELGDEGSILHTRMNYSWNKDWAEYDEFPAPFENEAALRERAAYGAWRKRLAELKAK